LIWHFWEATHTQRDLDNMSSHTAQEIRRPERPPQLRNHPAAGMTYEMMRNHERRQDYEEDFVTWIPLLTRVNQRWSPATVDQAASVDTGEGSSALALGLLSSWPRSLLSASTQPSTPKAPRVKRQQQA
jgi:hypothetical protein